ncbi:MAG: hypothetical protein HQ488_01675 [Parcubacteria group bacterium]|nr:hypothetical protein [Parcubacteria group bacterium]
MTRNILLFISLLAIGFVVLSMVKVPENETEVFVPEEVEQVVVEIVEDTPFVQDEMDSTRVEGAGFHFFIPDGWYVDPAPEIWERSGEGYFTYGWVRNIENESPFGHEDEVSFSVANVLKEDVNFDEVVSGWAESEEQMAGIVKYMQEESIAPYNEVTMDDVVVELEETEFLGKKAYVNTLICSKPCYIEGNPPAIVAYYLDDGDYVWILTARTIYSEKAIDLLDQAKEVMDSFVLE